MPTVGFGRMNADTTHEDLIEIVAKMQKTLDYLMQSGLDSKNIRAKSITADRMDVNELSAITANLGHIIAGLIEAVTIIGSYIATGNAYPKIELSSVANLLKAMTSENRYIAINPFDSTSTPSLDFRDNDLLVGVKIFLTSLGLSLVGISNTDININTSGSGSINLNPGGYVTIDSWTQFLNEITGRTLQQDLDAKAPAFFGATGSFTTADGKTVVVVNGIIASIT